MGIPAFGGARGRPVGSVARSVGRINGLGRRPGELYVGIPVLGGARGRPGELYVGIPAFGGARGWPVGRAEVSRINGLGW